MSPTTIEGHIGSRKKLIDNYRIHFLENKQSQLSIETRLLLPSHAEFEAFKAVLYATGGGSRSRPIVFLEVYEMLGGEIEYALESAIGIELLHTASTLQDDGYFMDRGNLRRGIPTTRIKFGESTAELATTHAWNEGRHLIGSNAHRHRNTGCNYFQVESLVNETIRLMIAGQELDLKKNKTDAESDASRIWKNRLFSLCTQLPVELLNLDKKIYIPPLAQIGNTISVVFQERDDILDFLGTERDRGKAVLADVGKRTLVQRIGLPSAIKKYNEGCNSIYRSLEDIPRNTSCLKDLVEYTLPPINLENTK